ncbi:MAG: hypothetical protein P8J01_09305 [Acidimicrobiales bacterium]|jgi:hypothetical protein|nr:hypothetical protein [Acidimicrobiales bacterium]MDG1846574.1 hypothetical protein [Acidimicrobiales bacterium]
MGRSLIHPLSKALYEKTPEGNVQVTNGDLQGTFRRDGSWIEGELRECDPQLCNWVSGPPVIHHRMRNFKD